MIADNIIRDDVLSIIESAGLEFAQLSGKTILVTGADGFIPSYFVDTVLILNEAMLKKNPVKLIVLTHHNISKNSRLNHCLNVPGIEFIVGDVTSASLPDRIDIIIHGASKASPKKYLDKLIETADVNVLGTKKLLEYCVRNNASKFLLISSSETYGDPSIFPIPESYTGNVDPIGPRSVYQESKRFAETLCYLYHKVHGVNTVIARLFHTYGPRLSLDDGRVIPEFIRRAMTGENLEVVDIKSIRTFCYISDSIEAMWRVLLFGKPSQAYNVGSEEEINIDDLATLIIRISQSQSRVTLVPPESIPYSVATPAKTTPSIEKIKALGHANKIHLEQGLQRLIDWYKNTKAS